MARLIADLPKLKAAVATEDPPTVQPLADEYREQIDADALVLSRPGGAVLATSGVETDALLQAGGRGHRRRDVDVRCRTRAACCRSSACRSSKARTRPNVLGRLTVGFFLDDRRAVQFKAVTGTEIAFAAGGRVLASSLPLESRGGARAR